MKKKADALLTSHSDLSAFCTAFNPSVQKFAAENTDRVFFGSAPMLCTIDAAYGEGSAAQWLIPQLFDLCATAGVKTKLDDFQLKQLACMIREEFGFLKASEVMLFFWRLKSGRYGQFYGAVDPMTVMIALRSQFMQERARVIDDMEKEKYTAWLDSLYNDPDRGPMRKEAGHAD